MSPYRTKQIQDKTARFVKPNLDLPNPQRVSESGLAAKGRLIANKV